MCTLGGVFVLPLVGAANKEGRALSVYARLSVSRIPAQHSSPSSSRVRSYVLSAVEEIWLANGFPGLSMDTSPVRIRIQQWYASPSRWRVESHYLTPPAQVALRRTFLPVFNVLGQDGRVSWAYDSYSHRAAVLRLFPIERRWRSFPAAFVEWALQGPVSPNAFQGASDWATVLKRISTCVFFGTPVPFSKPKLVGEGRVAGREAYVIDLGDKPCVWKPDPSHWAFRRRVVWVDKQTFFVLKFALYGRVHPRQLFERMTVTHLQYNVAIRPRRFIRPKQHLEPAYPPVAPPTPKPLEQIRRQVSFLVFVPTKLPFGLRPREPTVDGEQHVRIDYQGGGKRLKILEGPVGCCLDADPWKYERPTRLWTGRTAYLLHVAEHPGGLILWWDQGRSYVGLTGSKLSRGDVLRVAASMSKTAALRPWRLPLSRTARSSCFSVLARLGDRLNRSWVFQGREVTQVPLP